MYNYLTKRLKKKNRGFTLIEVIVVIGILAILSALAIPAVGGYINNAKDQTDLANAKVIYNAESAYLASGGSSLLPITATTGDSLVSKNYLASEPKLSTVGELFTLSTLSTDGKFTVNYKDRSGTSKTYPN